MQRRRTNERATLIATVIENISEDVMISFECNQIKKDDTLPDT